MKKITFIFLLISSLGFSQSFPFDFSTANQLFTGDACVTSLTTDAGNAVMQVVGGGALYDNAQKVLVQNINLADDNNNTITFRIKPATGSTSGSHLLKFEGGISGPATTELPFTTTGSAWQNISVNFGAGLGNYSKIVIFTDFNNTLTDTYLIDDIAGGTNVAPPTVPAPTVAAPTPTRNVSDVISLYSNAYTNGASWHPSWGQTTTFTEVQIAGNSTARLTSFGYEGIQTITPATLNLSTMTTAHFDVWTSDETSIKIYLLIAGEPNVTKTLIANQWNSFDIPLTDFGTGSMTAATGFKIESGTYVWPNGVSTVYVDNVYFWKPAAPAGTPVITGFSVPAKSLGDVPFALTAPTSNSPGAFTYTSSNTSVATVSGSTVTVVGVGTSTITANQAASSPYLAGSITAVLSVSPQAAPVPTLPASAVISMYGETYPNTWQYDFGANNLAGEPDLDPTTGVNKALKYNFELGGYGAGYTATNVSAMQFVHFDYFTTNSANFKFVLISNTGEKDYALPANQAIFLNTWKSVNIPMSYFTGLGFNPATWFQYKFDVNGVVPGVPNIVYIDNVYFTSNSLGVKDFTSAKVKMYPNPTASLFTIEANDTVESVSLFNVLGQEVLTNKFNANTVSLDISNLQTGVYVVKAVIGGVSSTSRIVKK